GVNPLSRFRDDPDVSGKLRKHWRFILDEINYYPIFNTAFDVLNCLSADDDIRRAIETMLESALWVVSRRAALRHRPAGRIFPRLLAEATHLGAFYTSIPAATLLLKLALPRGEGGFDWCSLEAIKGLAVADFACGTGTLLMATADAILDNHVRACA